MNKKNMRIAFFLCLGFGQNAFSATNQTFLRKRAHSAFLPIKMLKNEPKNQKSSNITLSYDFQHSRHRLNQYFLIHNKGALKLIATRADLDITTKGDMNDVDMTYLNHAAYFDQEDVTDLNAIGMVFTNKPIQVANGFQLAWQWYCNRSKTCFLYANVPVNHSKSSVSPVITGSPRSDYQVGLFEETIQFFIGDLEKPPFYTYIDNLELRAVSGRGQVKLANAKFSDKPLYSTGFSDIDTGIGYVFFDKSAYHLTGACVFTLPAGNKPKGEFVFEPIRGNGGHVGIGATADGWLQLLAGRKRDLKLVGALDWRYLFSAHEIRTLGLKNRDWGHYYNLGKVGQAEMIPAANILTRSVDVRPGSYLEGMLGLSYHDKEFVADIGYDVYVRGRESIRLFDFPDNTYAVAARGYSTAQPVYAPDGSVASVVPRLYTITPNTVDQGDVALSTVNLHTIDTSVAESPSQCINSMYGSFGFLLNDEYNAVSTLLSLGGMYEFPTSNAALEQWTIWVRLGVGF